MANNLLILNELEMAKAIEKAQYAEVDTVDVSHHISYDTKQIFITALMDNLAKTGDDDVKLKNVVISEVFTVSKFKVDLEIVLSTKVSYYRIKELSSIVGAVRTYIRIQSKKAIKGGE